jgi:hypothetical protein
VAQPCIHRFEVRQQRKNNSTYAAQTAQKWNTGLHFEGVHQSLHRKGWGRRTWFHKDAAEQLGALLLRGPVIYPRHIGLQADRLGQTARHHRYVCRASARWQVHECRAKRSCTGSGPMYVRMRSAVKREVADGWCLEKHYGQNVSMLRHQLLHLAGSRLHEVCGGRHLGNRCPDVHRCCGMAKNHSCLHLWRASRGACTRGGHDGMPACMSHVQNSDAWMEIKWRVIAMCAPRRPHTPGAAPLQDAWQWCRRCTWARVLAATLLQGCACPAATSHACASASAHPTMLTAQLALQLSPQ